jgi:hypothetical protein
VRRRLARLEERLPSREDLDTARRREVLKRMSVEELRGYVGALTRRRAGEPPAERDEAIFACARKLYGEVPSVLTAR